MKLLPALTAMVRDGWENKVKEIDALNLTEICLFPTPLDFDKRQELYKSLEKTNLQKIPFVHLREQDMKEDEIKYLIERWGAKIFNIHPLGEASDDLFPTLRDRIYVENLYGLEEKDLRGFAGVCVDFAHLENVRLTNPEDYKQVMAVIKKDNIGCAHISAVYPEPVKVLWKGLEQKKGRFEYHHADSPSRFDYLTNYPREMFPAIAAVEVENPLVEQLKFRDYILDLLKF
jgi:hypothetical protein